MSTMIAVPLEELNQLLAAMIQSANGISDMIFVVGKPPQVEVDGKLCPFVLDPTEAVLTSERVEGLAGAIINDNPRLLRDLSEHGSCDSCYSVKNFCRFRVNVYRQNGNFAMVLRRLPSQIPSIESLNLPPVFREIIKEKAGLVLVTGATGSGKTSTLAALLNEVNQTSEVHVVTLEDPIEFLHPHLRSTFSQRELGKDFFTYPDGLRAALRQGPKIILVGEIRDRATMEIALTAGETGHMVYSTLHTISAAQTINRILGIFNQEEEQMVRERLAGTLRYIVSQRLVPKQAGGRLLVTELMGSNLDTRELIALGGNKGRRLIDVIESVSFLGWHSFEQSLLKAYEENLITEETAIHNSVNRAVILQRLDALKSRREASHSHTTLKIHKEPDPAPPTKIRPNLAPGGKGFTVPMPP